MMNKETLKDEQYLREVSEKWNQCPICGSESSFEIKNKEHVLAYPARLICKNCSAEWYADRPFFFAGKIKGLILGKPDLEGHAIKYIGEVHSPEWWVEINLAEHVKKTKGDFEKDKQKSEDWKNKRGVVIKKWSEIAEKNPGLTQEELKEIYIRHYPEDEDIERYLGERNRLKDISQPTTKIIRYEKRYTGDNYLLCILLCIGIIPGVLYYLLARDTIPIYEEPPEQNV